jgi:predicted TIM-barrel fold metal-dependent hydrolase
MRGYYPEGTVFVVYSMDMHFMKAGKCRQSYKEQLDELAALKKKYPALIKPFIMLDPRRGKQEIEALAKEYIENRGFCGIKVYPLLGYYPYDDRLSGVYDYAQKNGIPVTGHCAGGPVFYRKKLTPDMIDLNAPVKPSDFKNPCYHYSHPKCFEKVAEKYPRLRLNLAHFGGGEQLDNYLGISWEHPDEKSSNWFVQVKRVMKKNKNVYSDVSGGFQQSRYLPVLKLAMLDSRISGRILYGSDFYMEQIDMTEREFSVEARAMLGEKDFFRIANENALKFLG